MKIGEVSNQLGIPASTIRYYEKHGLIARQARVSGVREFDTNAIFGLRFVQLAQAAGFSISEMKLLLENYDQTASVSDMWRVLAESKRATVKAQIEDLRRMDSVLEKLLTCECETLEKCVEVALSPNKSADNSVDD